jgi:hypothetical protein
MDIMLPQGCNLIALKRELQRGDEEFQLVLQSTLFQWSVLKYIQPILCQCTKVL